MTELGKEQDEKADVAAWIGLLGPAVVWLANFEIIYAGVLAVCGNNGKIVLVVCCLVALSLIAGCAFLSGRELKGESKHDARRMMAVVGLMSAAVFALVTVAQVIAILVNDPCLM